jgi:hypothetical protein
VLTLLSPRFTRRESTVVARIAGLPWAAGFNSSNTGGPTLGPPLGCSAANLSSSVFYGLLQCCATSSQLQIISSCAALSFLSFVSCISLVDIMAKRNRSQSTGQGDRCKRQASSNLKHASTAPHKTSTKLQQAAYGICTMRSQVLQPNALNALAAHHPNAEGHQVRPCLVSQPQTCCSTSIKQCCR